MVMRCSDANKFYFGQRGSNIIKQFSLSIDYDSRAAHGERQYMSPIMIFVENLAEALRTAETLANFALAEFSQSIHIDVLEKKNSAVLGGITRNISSG